MSEWISLHIYRHSDEDALLVEGIRPLIRGLTADGSLDAAFFLRYWQGGPHVRLRMKPSHTPYAADLCKNTATAALTRWCAENPTPRSLDAAQYARLANTLATPGDPAIDLRACGTVEEVRYQAENDRYGTGPALHACEDHFTTSSRIALDLLSDSDSAVRREVLAAAVLAHHFRSLDPGTAQELTTFWREHPVRNYPLTANLALSQLAPAASPYVEQLKQFHDSLKELSATLNSCSLGTYQPPRAAFGGAQVTTASAATTLDICVHLFLNRLGVSMPREALLRHWISEELTRAHHTAPAPNHPATPETSPRATPEGANA